MDCPLDLISLILICCVCLPASIHSVSVSKLEQNLAIKSATFTRHEVLKEGLYNVTWTVDTQKQLITFSVAAKTTGYVGFGISYKGGMNEADIVIGGVYPNGTTYFTDRYSEEKSTPVIDDQQDWVLISGFESDGHTFLNFSRSFDTCDDRDIPINDDTLNIIWALGETDTISYHGLHSRGNLAVNFLDPIVEVADISQFQNWTIAKEVILPKNETVYLCTFFRGPQISKKHHVVGFDMFFADAVSKHHTHHSDFFRCKAPKGQKAEEYFAQYLDTTFDCYNDARYFPVEHCSSFEFQWSIGGKATIFPENVGSPIGEDDETVEFFMTEVHYDNPKELSNLKIHSGMNFYLTDNLRPIEAGFIFVGQWSTKLYSITVPPNSQDFIVNSHCPSECTELLPQEGINVFLYLLHSHLSGRKQKVRHFRNGTEIPHLANDEHYDFNYQNNRLLREPVKILPGDSLSLECTYDTRWKEGKSVTGGRSPREEMCQTFLMYYPRTTSVNQCGTFFPQQKMLDYMGIQNVTIEKGEIDPTVTSPPHLQGKKYSQVVEEINWTPEKRQEFQNFIQHSNHEAYCSPFDLEPEKPFGYATYAKFDKPYVKPSVCPSPQTQTARPSTSTPKPVSCGSTRLSITSVLIASLFVTPFFLCVPSL